MASKQALKRNSAPKLKIASSLESATQGEALIIDRRGALMSARGARIRGWIFPIAYVTGISGAAWWLLGAVWGLPILIGTVIGVGLNTWLARPHMRGLAQLTAGDLVGAQASLERARRRKLPWARWAIDIQLARVHSLKGEWARARHLLEGARPRARGAHRFVLLYTLAHVNTVEGDLDGARAALAEARTGPTTPVFQLGAAAGNLLVAFHADSLHGLDEQELHEAGTLALTTNQAGSLLALLAWSADKRGDDELADHWLTESQSRMSVHLPTSAPKLNAWIQDQLAKRP